MAGDSSQLLGMDSLQPKTRNCFWPRIIKQLKDKAANSAKKSDYISAIKYITEVRINDLHFQYLV